MTSSSRQLLKRFILEQGPGVLDDRRRVRGFLMDLLVGQSRERFWLLTALDHGVVARLSQQGSGLASQLMMDGLARQLQEASGLPRVCARWAVESWAVALGLIADSGADAPPIERESTVEIKRDNGCDLAEVIRTASAGDVIRLGPGEYHDLVVVRSDIELVADGPTGSVVWHAAERPAITWLGGLGRIEGIAFRADHPGKLSVQVDSGEPIIGACHFDGAGGGLSVTGDASPHIERCEFNTQGQALACRGSSKPQVHRNQFRGQRDASVLVVESATISLEENTFTGGDGVAVALSDTATATMTANKIFDMKGGGVLVQGRAQVVSDGNVVRGTAGTGLLIQDQAGGLFKNDVFSHARYGIEVTSSGSPRFEQILSTANTAAGLSVTKGGSGEWLDCAFGENERFGVSVAHGANPLFRRCQFMQNRDSGILVSREGRGLFEQCSVFENEEYGVAIVDKGDPEFRDCSSWANSFGLGSFQGGKGSFSGGVLRSNKESGIVIFADGDVKVANVEILDNEHYGAYLQQTARGTIQDCVIRNNELGSWLVMPGARTDRRGNVAE